ncbi:MAG: hypothetical protein ABJB47_08390 [Actinomycetota bacterium]
MSTDGSETPFDGPQPSNYPTTMGAEFPGWRAWISQTGTWWAIRDSILTAGQVSAGCLPLLHADTGELSPAELTAVLARTRAGYHRAVAGMTQADNDVVMDHVLSERWRLIDCLRVLDGIDVVFVGVRYSPAELTRREQARGDRDPGTAAAQQGHVHAHGDYDLELDNAATSARDCALAIGDFVGHGPILPRAFDRLLRALLTGESR